MVSELEVDSVVQGDSDNGNSEGMLFRIFLSCEPRCRCWRCIIAVATGSFNLASARTVAHASGQVSYHATQDYILDGVVGRWAHLPNLDSVVIMMASLTDDEAPPSPP